jgi:hypothetical protein
MPRLISVVKSDKPDKKYVATFETDGRTKKTHFGATGYIDYVTPPHDKERRDAYRSRHKKDLSTRDPTRAGYLSYNLLWGNSTNFRDNLADYRRKYNL